MIAQRAVALAVSAAVAAVASPTAAVAAAHVAVHQPTFGGTAAEPAAAPLDPATRARLEQGLESLERLNASTPAGDAMKPELERRIADTRARLGGGAPAPAVVSGAAPPPGSGAEPAGVAGGAAATPAEGPSSEPGVQPAPAPEPQGRLSPAAKLAIAGGSVGLVGLVIGLSALAPAGRSKDLREAIERGDTQDPQGDLDEGNRLDGQAVGLAVAGGLVFGVGVGLLAAANARRKESRVELAATAGGAALRF